MRTPHLTSKSLCIAIPPNQRKTDPKMLPAKPSDVPRCPYCVSGNEFRVMKILENGRQICESCGHMVFPEDRAFWCPCQKCLEASSIRIQHMRH